MTHVNGNSVSAVLEVSRKVYATSLVLYPNELRREFGAEMVEVFDEQVSEAYSRSGFPGLLRAWSSATAELALMVWFSGYIGYVMETACAGCGH